MISAETQVKNLNFKVTHINAVTFKMCRIVIIEPYPIIQNDIHFFDTTFQTHRFAKYKTNICSRSNFAFNCEVCIKDQSHNAVFYFLHKTVFDFQHLWIYNFNINRNK